MDVIYMLIPVMIVLGLVMVGILVWAVKSGQYEDLEGDANRILMDDDDPLLPKDGEGKPGQRKPANREAGRNWPDAEDH